LNPLEYKLVMSYPRREYTFEKAQATLDELNFQSQELIHVFDSAE